MFPKGWTTRWVWISLLGGIVGLVVYWPRGGELASLEAGHSESAQILHSPAQIAYSSEANQMPHSESTNQITPQDGRPLLQQAILNLESRTWVAGKIHYYLELFDNESVVGKGTFSAQMSQFGQLFRWEVNLPFENRPFQWWELFDGQTLWTYQASPKDQKEQLGRVDVLQVAQHLKKQGNLPKIGEIGNWPGLGGLSRLLRSLQTNFQFTLLETSSFRATDGQQTRPLPVWKLLGTWKPAPLAALLPEQADRIQQGLPVRWEKVPPHIPDQVLLFLGQEDLFPYEIQYRRKPPGRWTAWLSQVAWLQREEQCLAKLEFVELSLDVPLETESFHYQPPEHLKPTNTTSEFIQQVHTKMQKKPQ